MRVFLVQTAHGLDSPSGGYKSNYGFINQLRSYGHAVAQTCYAFDEEIEECAAKAKDKGINPKVDRLPNIDFGRNPKTGLGQQVRVTKFVDENQILNIAISRHLWASYLGKEVTAETKAYIEGNDPSSRMANLINMYSTQIAEFQPTHVVFNDGLTMKITEQMLRSAGPQSSLKFKRVCVVHSAEQLPFGPFCGGLSGHCLSADSENEMMKGLDGIWSVSKGIRDYALTHGNLQTSFFVHNTWTYLDEGNIPMRRNNVDKTEVGLINACALKGLPIFVELAKRLPHIQFVAWMTWGSKQVYIDQLRELPNVKIESATKNTERDIWDRVKVLLVPSLWNEAWGAVITEAQLRGIPVMASNAGGIPEAKIGVPYLLPVNGLTGATDPKTGEYIVPKQDITPWEEALVKLMARDTSEYEQLSDYTARRTVQWIRGLDHRAQEKWLLDM
ncbi:hypothetical protein C8A00DRAFT_32777 [Chaetomidium leptoderma]|uniref:Glycosyl transferase family 1 domain-containing protein n=1 Tax=Chaetomidium leptoderma TaxID=669021 RepID=A0AAN6VMP6_9PEZI|nr:hypothetical protein C8A00DRAFT_32777 [Chaetomidium leptoderma]